MSMEVEEDQYFLRCYFEAHENDVRALLPVSLPHGGMVSGSRDLTIRIWKPKENDIGFVETAYMFGPTHFVSSLCTLPPSTEHPRGLVLAGSNDCAIYGFSLDTYQVVFKLLGHSGTVSSLAAGNFGTILSGSWDKTARVWIGQKSVLVLSGHQEAVWAVVMFPDQGLMATGSADKTIRLWRAGKTEKIFYGHEDCVRGLAVVSNSEFLSCSNDFTIRLWQTNGNCLAVFSGHTNYVYDISVLNEKGDFVSCSEDKTVRVWKSGVCTMSKEVPASCLWCVSTLSNGDFAVGGSNGHIYVFTEHSNLRAPDVVVSVYESKVIQMKEAAKLPRAEMGMPDDLPGPEILLSPGVINGQKAICKEGNNLVTFEWDAVEKAWRNDSNVNDLRYPDSNFQQDGQGFDQIFDIDVDGVMLKLPYRNSENPYQAAEDFVNKHQITPAYTEQIARHIIENTNAPATNYGYNAAAFADPFTGADRYIPNASDKPSTYPSPSNANGSGEMIDQQTAFPVSEYVIFHIYNMQGLEKKLLEYSERVEKESTVSAAEIKNLLLLVEFPTKVNSEQMESLQKILYWPDEFVFPALDLFRLAIRSHIVTKKVSEAGEPTLIRYLLKHLNSKCAYPITMFTLRIFCNFFGNEFGEKLLFNNIEAICSDAAICVPTDHKQVEIALTTLYLNYAVAINKSIDRKNMIVTESVIRVFSMIKDHDARFRLMVCIGTLVEDSSAADTIKSADIKTGLRNYMASDGLPIKNKICVKQLLKRID